MDPTNYSLNKFKEVIIFSNEFIVGKSIYNSNENNILQGQKYILNFIKKMNKNKIK